MSGVVPNDLEDVGNIPSSIYVTQSEGDRQGIDCRRTEFVIELGTGPGLLHL